MFESFSNVTMPRNLPKRRLFDLVLGEEYRVLDMMEVCTKYGSVAIPILQDKDNKIFKIYLRNPSRFFTELDLWVIDHYPYYLSYEQLTDEVFKVYIRPFSQTCRVDKEDKID